MKDNKTNKPILTISILSSNRKDTIRKCLDSLKTLRERVSSELIIVDTAHDEEMRNILLEYTDQIIPFTWCNDFSKARNVGLEAANGEWFLYLDDDEWFIDTAEIEEFFLSGDYKKYTLAYYLQRNFSDYAGSNYNDARVSRMFRIWNNIRFVSSIHEYPHPLSGESKLLHSAVEHYGYVYDTEEKRFQHARRNIPLLMDMIKKERKNPRWWLQLLQEYRTINQYREMQKCCEEALQVFRGINHPEVNIARGSLYNAIIASHLKYFEYSEAETVLKKAMQDKHLTPMCWAALYGAGANLHFHHKEYALCEEYCEKYLEIYEQLKDNDEERYKQGYFFVDEAFLQNNLEQLYCIYICCGLQRNDTAILKEYFWKLNWSAHVLFLESSFVLYMIDAFSTLPYDEEFVKMASAMMGRNGVDDQIITCLQKKEKIEEEFKRLEKIFLQMTGHQTYILYLKLRNMKTVKEIQTFMSNLSFYEWKVTIDYFCACAPKEKIEEAEAWLHMIPDKYGSGRDYFFLKEAEVNLTRHDRNDYDGLRVCIDDFCTKNSTFFSRFFKKSAFSGEMEMLPIQGRIAVKLRKVLDAEDRGDVKAVSAALKSSLNVYPSLNDVIKAYSVLYAKQQQKQLDEKKRKEEQEQVMISAQMQYLGKQIKGKIRFLLEQNLLTEAQQTLEQLRSIIPGDEELDELEQEIRKRLP